MSDLGNAPYRGELLHFHELARYNSWHIGGVARQFYKPIDLDDCVRFVASLPQDERLIWLGLGSNVLFPDGILDATVISTRGALNQLSVVADDVIRAESGVTCSKLARFSANFGFESAAFFAGIPGTVGGALAMNAGAFGGQTWSQVHAVEMLDQQGQITVHSPEAFQVGYRQVDGPEGFFVAGTFKFASGQVDQSREAIKNLLQRRNNSQPIGTWNCGSVFRNPPDDYAARLIEAAGLKGYCIGGAQISTMHANFIVNLGEATADDVCQLMDKIQTVVHDLFKVLLVPEVHVISAD